MIIDWNSGHPIKKTNPCPMGCPTFGKYHQKPSIRAIKNIRKMGQADFQPILSENDTLTVTIFMEFTIVTYECHEILMFTNSIIIVTWVSLNFKIFTNMFTHPKQCHSPHWAHSGMIPWIFHQAICQAICQGAKYSVSPTKANFSSLARATFKAFAWHHQRIFSPFWVNKNHGFVWQISKPSIICPTLIWFSHWYTKSIPKTRGGYYLGFAGLLTRCVQSTCCFGAGQFLISAQSQDFDQKKSRTLPFSDSCNSYNS